jgi:4a-hydroxytetrahydrobiopterin dehydratase
MRRMSKGEIGRAMKRLSGWSLRKGKLHREFVFGSFDDAIAFIDRLRPIANAMNHHPELYNVYDKVAIDLVTHDAGGLTSLDFELARKIDSVARAQMLRLPSPSAARRRTSSR